MTLSKRLKEFVITPVTFNPFPNLFNHTNDRQQPFPINTTLMITDLIQRNITTSCEITGPY